GVELDATAESERELACDRETEPGAASVARVGVREERAEDALALLRPDSGAGVADQDRDGAVRRRQTEVDAAAVGRPAERVREQVGDDLQYAVAVRDDHRPRVDIAVVVDRAPPRLLAERSVGLVEQAAHVDLLAQQGESVRVELG